MSTMKRIFLQIVLMTTIISTTSSQDYKKFEWDILGVSYLLSTSNNIGSAFGLYTEPRFNLNNKISIGLNYNWQFFDPLFDEPIRSLGITTSYALAVDYYVFNDFNKRAFAGIAIGSFNNAATTESGIDVGGSGFGLTPRIGYELDFLRFNIKYNLTLKNDFPNYFAIGLGLNIGGRHKRIEKN